MRPERSPSEVKGIQYALAALGHDAGPIDGLLGPKTRAAIRAFEADHGLPVTGQVSDAFESALEAEIAAAPPEVDEAQDAVALYATGTGFSVSAESHVLTNYHVVEECLEIQVRRGQEVSSVRVTASDPTSDLAILEPAGDSPDQMNTPPARFRDGRGIRPGDDVVVIGFPLQGLLADEPSVTTGIVSSLAGPGNDRRLIQITAPVQMGNSGGPLLDISGNVVGVAVGNLDALNVALLTGDIPQNVNFAISEGAVRGFLDAHGVPYETGLSEEEFSPADIASQARQFTAIVECWQ